MNFSHAEISWPPAYDSQPLNDLRNIIYGRSSGLISLMWLNDAA
jgi:hypothetical protein